MISFDLQKFSTHIKDVDKDLREMALFDLHQVLKFPSFHFPDSDCDTVVDSVLRCLSKDEVDKGVRNSAVQVVPLLLLVLNERHQVKISSVLCSSATAQTARLGERGYSDALDSSAFALKLCCESIADKARGNIEQWKHLCATAMNINSILFSSIKQTENVIVKDTCYGAINSLIDPFGQVYPCEIRDAMAQVALSDITIVGQVRRRAIVCLSLLAPLISDNVLALVSQIAFDSLERECDHSKMLSQLQLCEFLVKNVPCRVSLRIFNAANAVLNQLQKSADGSVSDDDDTFDFWIRLLVCFVNKYPNELSSLHRSIFGQCISLLSFDPNYCGDTEDADPFDEYYIEEEVDLSWKIRAGSAEVLSSILEISQESSLLVRLLKPENLSGVNDRVEEVQVASLRLVNSILQQSKNPVEWPFCNDILNSLFTCMNNSNQKVSVIAASTIQLLLHICGNDFIMNNDNIYRVLSNILRDHCKTRYALKAEVIPLAQLVIAAAQADPLNVNLAIELSQNVLDNGGPNSSLRMNLNILYAFKTIVHVAKVGDNNLADRCVALLFSLIDGKITDREMCRNVLDDIGYCLTTLSSVLSNDSIERCIKYLVSLAQSDAGSLQVLRSVIEKLGTLIISVECFEQLCSYLNRQGRSYQHLELIIRAVSSIIASGVVPTESSLSFLIQFTSSTAFTSGDAGLIQSSFDFLKVLCDTSANTAHRVMVLLPSVWDALHSTSIASHSLHIRVVESAASFFSVLCRQLPKEISTFHDAVLKFISSSKFEHVDCDLLSGFVRDCNVELLLNRLSSFSTDNSLVCLCAGVIGRYQPLPDAWKIRLLNSLENEDSETTRRFVWLALGRAASNPRNISLLHEMVSQATSDKRERYAYWKALKESLQIAACQSVSSYSDHSFSYSVGKRLIEKPLDDDVETTASVLSGLAPFILEELLQMTVTYMNNGPELTRPTCLSTQRYLTSYCTSETDNVLLSDALSVSFHALDRKSDVKVRLAFLQLFATIASSKPHLLLSPWMKSIVYPGILSELLEDKSLIMTINLGTYTHREDKGIEVRRLAFECISILLRNARQQKSSKVLDYYGRLDELLEKLVHGCGPRNGGEVDEDLNNQSRILIVHLVKIYPNLSWNEVLMKSLLEKLNSSLETNVEGTAVDVEKKKISLKFTLNCVIGLSGSSPFAYNPLFHSILLSARQSPFLLEAVRMS